MTDPAVVKAIRRRGYPDDLSDDEITEACEGVRRDLKFEYVLNTYGSFTSVGNQQVYDLFNAVEDLTVSQGVFPNGIWVQDIIWSPVGTGQSLDVFGIAPFLQGLTIAPGEITTYSFQTPTDFWMWDLNWNAFVKRFGPMGFEHVENRPGSPVRLFPTPREARTIFCRYTRYRTTAEIQSEDESWYLAMIEAQCAYTVANKLRAGAGTRLGAIASDGKNALYWDAYGKRKYDEGWDSFNRRKYVNFAPEGRS